MVTVPATTISAPGLMPLWPLIGVRMTLPSASTTWMVAALAAMSSWESQHLTYTNGHGIVAAPSNAKDSNGRPVFLSRDVPMRTAEDALKLGQFSDLRAVRRQELALKT